MELELENDLVIQCEICGTVQVIDKDSLDVDTSSYERNMGAEVEYDFQGECTCPECGNELSYTVRAYEYPVGALEFFDHECRGCHFVQSPEIGVRYYEFEYDYDDEEIIGKEVKYVCDNIYEIVDNPSKMYELTPREFEELVARVFQQQGFEVELTPETRDGGCDVIATKNIGGMPFMLLIECKRYAVEHHVGVALVRSLLGVQEDMKANKAVLVTTSTFSKPAREFADRQQHLISLIDINDLINMMNI